MSSAIVIANIRARVLSQYGSECQSFARLNSYRLQDFSVYMKIFIILLILNLTFVCE